jgi:hypothetical protein
MRASRGGLSPLLSGMENMYSPSMGPVGWELLTDDEKRAWWGQADELSKNHLRAALEESRIQPKKLGAPHSTGPPYKLGPSVRSMPNTLSPLMPGDVPIDVQRPTEKIITGPLRQAIEEEVLGTPGREPIIPPGDIAARDAELFGLGELDVAMDEAIAGGVLRKELGQYGDEFEGIYQYFKSRGVPESKISEFWKRTINQMGDFEGKTLWKVEGTQDLISAQTGEVIPGFRNPKSHLKVVQEQFTGGQPTEEKMIKEEVQKLVDGGMHRGDAEFKVREEGMRVRTSEQMALTDDPLVTGRPWQAKAGTPAYDMVTERAGEWADQHGIHRVPTGADDPRSRFSEQHPRFNEFHRKRLAELRAASQAEARIGQTIALDPITGEPGFPGQKFFGSPGDLPTSGLPDPTPGTLFGGRGRPPGMEQYLGEIKDYEDIIRRMEQGTRPAPGDPVHPNIKGTGAEDMLRGMREHGYPRYFMDPGAGETFTPEQKLRLQELKDEMVKLDQLFAQPDHPDFLGHGTEGRSAARDRYRDAYEEVEKISKRQQQIMFEDMNKDPTGELFDPEWKGEKRHQGQRAFDSPEERLMEDALSDLGDELPGAGQGRPPSEGPPRLTGEIPDPGAGRITYPRPYPELDVNPETILDNQIDADIARREAARRAIRNPANEQQVRNLLEELRRPTEGSSLLANRRLWPEAQILPLEDTDKFFRKELDPLTGEVRMVPKGLHYSPDVQLGLPGMGPEDYLYNRNAQKLYKEYWDLRRLGYAADISAEQLFDQNNKLRWLSTDLKKMGVPFSKMGRIEPSVGQWDHNPDGKSVLEGEPYTEAGRAKPTELAGPGELTGGVRPPGEPPVALAAGADDFSSANQSLNDAVNEFRASGMTDEAAAALKAKALKKPKGWFSELTAWLRSNGGMRRASMTNLIDDVIKTMRGTTPTLGQAAVTPTPRVSAAALKRDGLTQAEIDYRGSQEVRQAIKQSDVIEMSAAELQKIIDEGDLGMLARRQAAAETPLQAAENMIRRGNEAFAEATRMNEASRIAGGGPEARDAGPVQKTKPIVRADIDIIKKELDIMVKNDYMTSAKRNSYLGMLEKGEKNIMSHMSVEEQRRLLRLMGETRPGYSYKARNAAYKKLLAGNTLSRWQLTKALIRSNPSFRGTMMQALGIGMTAAERTAQGTGAMLLTKRLVGRTVHGGMGAAGLLGKAITGPPGMVELAVSSGQLLDDAFRGPGHTPFGGYNRAIPLQINLQDVDRQVEERLDAPGNLIPWTRAHVIMEIMFAHGLVGEEDAKQLAKQLDDLTLVSSRSRDAQEIANRFNTKLKLLIKNAAFAYDRSVDFVEPIEDFPSIRDAISRIPILHHLTDPYALAGVGGAGAPPWIDWAKNPRSLSQRVEKIRVKVTSANAVESGHIAPQLLMLVAPDLRYQKIKKDEGLSMFDLRLMESYGKGGVPHARRDLFHEQLTQLPVGWQEGDPVGTLKVSDEEWAKLFKHPQGKKLLDDLAAGKVIALNPLTGLPYDIDNPNRDPQFRPTFDPELEYKKPTMPPDFLWVMAANKYDSLFTGLVGSNRAPTWAEYKLWKAKSSLRGYTPEALKRDWQTLPGMTPAQSRARLGIPKGKIYGTEHFFLEYEHILDEMYAAGIGRSKDGVGITTRQTGVDSLTIPSPLVNMWTGQEVIDGEQQRPRFSFTDDFNKSSRTYQKHLSPSQALPQSQKLIVDETWDAYR